jgi:phage terminase Nu1 subunit (DNA packaging protein)
MKIKQTAIGAQSRPLYPAKTIANLFNLTERRIQQLAAEGIIPKEARGKYDLVAAVRGYIKYLQDRAFGQDVGSSEFTSHRERLVKANADKAEMENDLMRGDSVPTDAVKFAVSDFAAQAQSIFEGIPKRIKNSLPSLRAREMKILEREIVKAQNAASEIRVAFDIVEVDGSEF